MATKIGKSTTDGKLTIDTTGLAPYIEGLGDAIKAFRNTRDAIYKMIVEDGDTLWLVDWETGEVIWCDENFELWLNYFRECDATLEECLKMLERYPEHIEQAMKRYEQLEERFGDSANFEEFRYAYDDL